MKVNKASNNRRLAQKQKGILATTRNECPTAAGEEGDDEKREEDAEEEEKQRPSSLKRNGTRRGSTGREAWPAYASKLPARSTHTHVACGV